MEHNLSDSEFSPKFSKTDAIQNLSTYHLAKIFLHSESFTNKLRLPLREKNQKQKIEKMKLPVKKVRVGGYHKYTATMHIRRLELRVTQATMVLGPPLEKQSDEGCVI